MWRNIPCKYTVSLLKSIVDPQYKVSSAALLPPQQTQLTGSNPIECSSFCVCINQGLYDFFYLPIDFRNKRIPDRTYGIADTAGRESLVVCVCVLPASGNIGYAFLNFLHPSFADSFTKQFNGHKLSHFKSNKVRIHEYTNAAGTRMMNDGRTDGWMDGWIVCPQVSEVCWAHIQGLDANIDHFRNSAVRPTWMAWHTRMHHTLLSPFPPPSLLLCYVVHSFVQLMSVPNPDHKPILFRNGVAQPFPAPTRDRPPTRERDTPSTTTHTHRSAALAEAPTRRFVHRDDYGKGYGHHQHHQHPAHHLMEYGSPWGSNGDRDSTGKRRFIPVHGHHREHSHTGGGRPDNRRD